jgi:hypothetical protein
MSEQGENGHSPVTGKEAAKLLLEEQFASIEVGHAKLLLRKVGIDELMAEGFLPPVAELRTMSANDRAAIFQTNTLEKADGLSKLMEAVIARGVVSPQVWRGGYDTCPEGQVPIEALAGYKQQIFSEVMRHSGFDAEVVEASRFPGAEATAEEVPAAGEGGEPHAVSAPEGSDR